MYPKNMLFNYNLFLLREKNVSVFLVIIFVLPRSP